MCVCVCIGVPEGEAAVNWRVAVYWPGDQTFFNATITKYRPETKQHEVRAVIHTHTHTHPHSLTDIGTAQSWAFCPACGPHCL